MFDNNPFINKKKTIAFLVVGSVILAGLLVWLFLTAPKPMTPEQEAEARAMLAAEAEKWRDRDEERRG